MLPRSEPIDVTTILAQPRAALDRIVMLEQENAGLRLEIDKLKATIAGYESWRRGIDEALNSGDGSYRP